MDLREAVEFLRVDWFESVQPCEACERCEGFRGRPLAYMMGCCGITMQGKEEGRAGGGLDECWIFFFRSRS